MLIRIGYDIQFDLPAAAAMVTLLHVHPSREKDLIEPDTLHIEPQVDAPSTSTVSAIAAPASSPRRACCGCTTPRSSKTRASLTKLNIHAREVPVGEVPSEFLCYLLNSRYCEVDRFTNIAYELFGHIIPGWSRVQAICDWVHGKVRSAIPMRAQRSQPSTSTRSASAYAATSSTWPSPSAAP